MTIKVKGVEELGNAARQLLENTEGSRIFIFKGEMGAGKTTFIRYICRQLGVAEAVQSPTFSLVNEYLITSTGEKVYHFDFYRIKNIEEVYDMGYEDYFYSKNYCLIEWPEKIDSLIPVDNVEISIKIEDQNTRIITVNK